MLKRICKNVTLPGVEGCLVVFILEKEITFFKMNDPHLTISYANRD